LKSLPDRVDIDDIIAEYSIDVDSTSLIRLRGLKGSTNVFKVDRSDLIEELYIVDTIQGKGIACHPHIVGQRLRDLAFDTALEAAKTIEQLADLSSVDQDCVVVENVLRAAPGYELNSAFRELNRGKSFRGVWIRPRYETPSYRSHDEESSRCLSVVYEDFDALPHNKEIVVLKPDTEATGRTAQKSIERIIDKCENVGSTVREIILYGFISVPGLKTISETAKKNSIELAAFAIGNVTALAHNGYDMTLYGVDESFWEATRQIKKLRSIVDATTLKRYLPEFVPGSDQPGDWSNRQTSIYVTREKKEPGRIEQHLQNSIELIQRLRGISDYSPWQEEIADNELRLLHTALEEHSAC